MTLNSVQLWIVIGAVALAGLGYLLTRRHTKHFPDMSDDDFVKAFKEKYDGPEQLIIKERRAIASKLGIPSTKLTPEQTFIELGKYLNFLGSYNLAIGDLEEEISELLEKARIREPYRMATTIGELIHQTIIAQQMLNEGRQSKDSHR